MGWTAVRQCAAVSGPFTRITLTHRGLWPRVRTRSTLDEITRKLPRTVGPLAEQEILFLRTLAQRLDRNAIGCGIGCGIRARRLDGPTAAENSQNDRRQCRASRHFSTSLHQEQRAILMPGWRINAHQRAGPRGLWLSSPSSADDDVESPVATIQLVAIVFTRQIVQKRMDRFRVMLVLCMWNVRDLLKSKPHARSTARKLSAPVFASVRATALGSAISRRRHSLRRGAVSRRRARESYDCASCALRA